MSASATSAPSGPVPFPEGPPEGPPSGGPALRVFEFFSGIGGLRLGLLGALHALRDSGLRAPPPVASFVGSFDIHAAANAVYVHNFGDTPRCVSVEHLSLRQLDGQADVWLLSPPCQPFTRGGRRLDAADGRATGLLHLLSLLEASSSPPLFFFLENVRGFEHSDTRQRMQQVLRAKGYLVKEFLLSPTQLGIPNTRVRYYCLATRQHQQPQQQKRQQEVQQELQQEQQQEPQQEEQHRQQQQEEEEACASPSCSGSFPPAGLCLTPPSVSVAFGAFGGSRCMRCVGEFLQSPLPEEEAADLLVPLSRLSRFVCWDRPIPGNNAKVTSASNSEMKEAESKDFSSGNSSSRSCSRNSSSGRSEGFKLEIVSGASTACGTFTKGYGQNIHSGGPLLLIEEPLHIKATHPTDSPTNPAATAAPTTTAAAAPTAAAAVLHPHLLEAGRFRRLSVGEKVRFFSSREMLRLHGFPDSFTFPSSSHFSFRRKAALIGNSVNVPVARHTGPQTLRAAPAAPAAAAAAAAGSNLPVRGPPRSSSRPERPTPKREPRGRANMKCNDTTSLHACMHAFVALTAAAGPPPARVMQAGPGGAPQCSHNGQAANKPRKWLTHSHDARLPLPPSAAPSTAVPCCCCS
ncbi:hypothetical protein Efla_006586 [Eimeria flavescens]